MNSNNSQIFTTALNALEPWISFLGFGITATLANLFILAVHVFYWKLLRKNAFIVGLAIGDTVNGLALVVNGAIRIVITKNGTINDPVHPSYCMTHFLTPLFLLGNQIPGFMFMLSGVERFLAVVCFDWYRVNWSDKLSWKLVAIFNLCSAISVAVAFVMVFISDTSLRVSLICGTGGVIGTKYSVYNYGISVFGGVAAVIATLIALVNFNRRKNKNLGKNAAVEMHLKKQWNISKTMFCLAVLDFGLAVVPNFLVGLGAIFSIPSFLPLYAWVLQIVSLRSSLNIVIYFVINPQFKTAVIQLFKK